MSPGFISRSKTGVPFWSRTLIQHASFARITIRAGASTAPKTCASPGPGITDAPPSLGGKAAVCVGGSIAVCGRLMLGGGFNTGASSLVSGAGALAAGGGVTAGAGDSIAGGGGGGGGGASFDVDSVVAAGAGAAGVGVGASWPAGAAGGGNIADGTALTRCGRTRPPDDR